MVFVRVIFFVIHHHVDDRLEHGVQFYLRHFRAVLHQTLHFFHGDDDGFFHIFVRRQERSQIRIQVVPVGVPTDELVISVRFLRLDDELRAVTYGCRGGQQIVILVDKDTARPKHGIPNARYRNARRDQAVCFSFLFYFIRQIHAVGDLIRSVKVNGDLRVAADPEVEGIRAVFARFHAHQFDARRGVFVEVVDIRLIGQGIFRDLVPSQRVRRLEGDVSLRERSCLIDLQHFQAIEHVIVVRRNGNAHGVGGRRLHRCGRNGGKHGGVRSHRSVPYFHGDGSRRRGGDRARIRSRHGNSRADVHVGVVIRRRRMDSFARSRRFDRRHAVSLDGAVISSQIACVDLRRDVRFRVRVVQHEFKVVPHVHGIGVFFDHGGGHGDVQAERQIGSRHAVRHFVFRRIRRYRQIGIISAVRRDIFIRIGDRQRNGRFLFEVDAEGAVAHNERFDRARRGVSRRGVPYGDIHDVSSVARHIRDRALTAYDLSFRSVREYLVNAVNFEARSFLRLDLNDAEIFQFKIERLTAFVQVFRKFLYTVSVFHDRDGNAPRGGILRERNGLQFSVLAIEHACRHLVLIGNDIRIINKVNGRYAQRRVGVRRSVGRRRKGLIGRNDGIFRHKSRGSARIESRARSEVDERGGIGDLVSFKQRRFDVERTELSDRFGRVNDDLVIVVDNAVFTVQRLEIFDLTVQNDLDIVNNGRDLKGDAQGAVADERSRTVDKRGGDVQHDGVTVPVVFRSVGRSRRRFRHSKRFQNAVVRLL